jgi:large subunit ribosomal protein L15
MNLSDLYPDVGARRARKRIGRGQGSGYGKTSGFGTKGAKARTGHHKTKRTFMGGQTPIQMQLPYKRGFKNPFRLPRYEVNIEQLAGFEANAEVTPDALVEQGIIRDTTMPVVILNRGTVSVPLTVRAHRVSKSAQAAIEAAGGAVQIIEEDGTQNGIQPGRPGGPRAPKTERKTPVSGS